MCSRAALMSSWAFLQSTCDLIETKSSLLVINFVLTDLELKMSFDRTFSLIDHDQLDSLTPLLPTLWLKYMNEEMCTIIVITTINTIHLNTLHWLHRLLNQYVIRK